MHLGVESVAAECELLAALPVHLPLTPFRHRPLARKVPRQDRPDPLQPQLRQLRKPRPLRNRRLDFGLVGFGHSDDKGRSPFFLGCVRLQTPAYPGPGSSRPQDRLRQRVEAALQRSRRPRVADGVHAILTVELGERACASVDQTNGTSLRNPI